MSWVLLSAEYGIAQEHLTMKGEVVVVHHPLRYSTVNMADITISSLKSATSVYGL